MSRAGRSDEELLRLVGARIKAAREREDMTQERLAEALGIGPDTISRYETAAIPISLTRLKQIADELDMDIAAFIRPESSTAGGEDEEILAVWQAVAARSNP